MCVVVIVVFKYNKYKIITLSWIKDKKLYVF